jgi:hypothetical protein
MYVYISTVCKAETGNVYERLILTAKEMMQFKNYTIRCERSINTDLEED